MSKKKNSQSLKHIFSNQMFILKICFKATPGFILYILFDAFRYQFCVFLEHTFGINYVLETAEFGRPFSQAVTFLLIMIGIMAVLMVIDGYYCNRMLLHQRPKLDKALKEVLYEKAVQLDLNCYDDPEYYNNFVLSVAEAEKCIDRFLELLRLIVTSITIMVTSGAFYLSTDAFGVVFIVVSFTMTFLFSKIMNKLNYEARMKVNPLERKRAYTQRVSYLNEYAKELRLNPGISDMIMDDFDTLNDNIIHIVKNDYAKKRVRIGFLRNYISGDFITDGLYVIYLVYKAAFLHTISYSNAVVLFGSTGSIKRGLRGFSDMIPKAAENSLYIDKLRAFLAYESNITSKKDLEVPKESKIMELNNVSFAYTEKSKNVLNHINMTIKANEKIALVGYNGAGKTTLIKLIMRLYDPKEGKLTLDGKNIKDYNVKDYRNHIGVVFQDYKIYGATLKENVLLNIVSKEHEKKKEEDCETIDALQSSGFGKRLETLPNGLETGLTTEFDESGVNLSGGESQKVAIARAFFNRSSMLIMDEPSSAMDPIAEYSLNKAMQRVAVNKSVVYISHRLSTTRDADRIYMMENGAIIEEGTHEELLRMNGKYARMWNVQASRYQ